MPFFEIDFIRTINPTIHDFNTTSTTSVDKGAAEASAHSDVGASKPTDSSPQPSRVKYTNTVEIRTDLEGFNSGRVYYIRAESGQECLRIGEDLRRFSAIARRHFELRSAWERFRDRLKSIYESAWVQVIVGSLILLVIV